MVLIGDFYNNYHGHLVCFTVPTASKSKGKQFDDVLQELL